MRWDEGETMEIIEIVKLDISKLLKNFNPYQVHDSDEISATVLKECVETLAEPLEMLASGALPAVRVIANRGGMDVWLTWN